MTTDTTPPRVTSRRALFAGAGAVGAGVVLAACGDGDGDGNGGGPAGAGDPRPPTDGSPDQGQQPPTQQPDEGAAGALAEVSEVEVGGGVVVREENVVVTQPSEGEFRGFSATCTHQGCQVSAVSDGLINCFCHGSQYSIEDGSVVRAGTGLTPQTQNPLPAVEVAVEGDAVVRSG